MAARRIGGSRRRYGEFTVDSSDPNKQAYLVTVEAGHARCGCDGFRYREWCRHVQEVRDLLVSEGLPVDEAAEWCAPGHPAEPRRVTATAGSVIEHRRVKRDSYGREKADSRTLENALRAQLPADARLPFPLDGHESNIRTVREPDWFDDFLRTL